MTREHFRGVHSTGTRRLIQAAQDAGWKVEWTGGGHIKFIPPSGRPIFTSGTPSDHRTTQNLKHRLRREGLDL